MYWLPLCLSQEGKTADEMEVKVGMYTIFLLNIFWSWNDKVSYCLLSVIPSEIRKRGPRAIEIYRSALRDVSAKPA